MELNTISQHKGIVELGSSSVNSQSLLNEASSLKSSDHLQNLTHKKGISVHAPVFESAVAEHKSSIGTKTKLSLESIVHEYEKTKPKAVNALVKLTTELLQIAEIKGSPIGDDKLINLLDKIGGGENGATLVKHMREDALETRYQKELTDNKIKTTFNIKVVEEENEKSKPDSINKFSKLTNDLMTFTAQRGKAFGIDELRGIFSKIDDGMEVKQIKKDLRMGAMEALHNRQKDVSLQSLQFKAELAFTRSFANGQLWTGQSAEKIPQSLVNKGLTYFNDVDNNFKSGLDYANKLSQLNIEVLNDSLGALNKEEEQFVKDFKNIPFKMLHMTSEDRTMDNQHLHLYSRQVLVDKDILPPIAKGNTEQQDILSLANDDFVFFSVEPGLESLKFASRFGNTSHRLQLANEVIPDTASTYLTDVVKSNTNDAETIKRYLKPHLPENLQDKIGDALAKVAGKHISLFNQVFCGKENIKEGLAKTLLTLIRDVGKNTDLDGDDQKELRNTLMTFAKDPKKTNALLAGFIRVQVVVPRAVIADENQVLTVSDLNATKAFKLVKDIEDKNPQQAYINQNGCKISDIEIGGSSRRAYLDARLAKLEQQVEIATEGLKAGNQFFTSSQRESLNSLINEQRQLAKEKALQRDMEASMASLKSDTLSRGDEIDTGKTRLALGKIKKIYHTIRDGDPRIDHEVKPFGKLVSRMMKEFVKEYASIDGDVTREDARKEGKYRQQFKLFMVQKLEEKVQSLNKILTEYADDKQALNTSKSNTTYDDLAELHNKLTELKEKYSLRK